MNSVADFRTRREASIRSEYGWLALAGLFWLSQGENAIGSGHDNPVRLPGRAPARVGVFTLTDGEVTLTPEPSFDIRLNDQPLAATSRTLKPDASGKPDYIFVGDIRMMVIERAGELAIRVWDPQNPVRQNFAGCDWYAPDESYRVRAKVERFAKPKTVMVVDSIGMERPGELHAALTFERHGELHRLEAEARDDGTYYIIFRDATAGKTTYGSGRYLTTEVAKDGEVIIDFNIAYNPPCAFTEFATCPLPLPENILPIAIEAGEKYSHNYV
jgi:uncharacterized protein (DUF1684 family)